MGADKAPARAEGILQSIFRAFPADSQGRITGPSKPHRIPHNENTMLPPCCFPLATNRSFYPFEGCRRHPSAPSRWLSAATPPEMMRKTTHPAGVAALARFQPNQGKSRQSRSEKWSSSTAAPAGAVCGFSARGGNPRVCHLVRPIGARAGTGSWSAG